MMILIIMLILKRKKFPIFNFFKSNIIKFDIFKFNLKNT